MSIELVSDDTLVTIENMVGHDVSYIVSSLGVRRKLMPGVPFQVTAKELRALYGEPGGEVMIRSFIRVKNEQLQREFGIPADQVEYNWTVKDVDDVLLNKEEDYLLDALDFAPEGIVDLILQRAIELELPNMNKRKAIMNKTGVNITKSIENRHVYDSENTSGNVAQKRSRRVQEHAEETPQRRVH